MKKIPYFYEHDTAKIAELVEKPKAKFFKEGALPNAPLKIKIRDAREETKNPYAFFRTTHKGILEISWLRYIWLKLCGFNDEKILNLKL